MRVSGTTILFSCLGFLFGCNLSGEHAVLSTGSATAPVSSVNRLTFNRLTFNRLTFNRLTFNKLSSDRLSSNELSYNSVDDLETTPEGRDLLLYIARCALSDGDVLVAEYEGTAYEFPGLLGLAPGWEYRGLTFQEEHLMSACLITHINAFDVSVPISVRSHGVLRAGPQEMVDFPVYEGTFFGNVFGETLETYSCIGDLPEIATQHSSYRSQRVCTDPSSDCEVVSLGRCQDVCETYHPKYGWQDCWANGTLYSETISAYLIDDSGGKLNRACGPNEQCSFACGGGEDAILDCSEAERCSSSCTDGSTCTLEGSTSSNYVAVVAGGSVASVTCHEGGMSGVECSGSQCDIGCRGTRSLSVVADSAATADISCREANECRVACEDGSDCDIDCTDANECHRQISCTGGSSCLLECKGAVECGFEVCEGTLQVCADGVVTCNRPCP